MRGENFNTAEMLKRLQRQVSRMQGGDTDDSVAVILETDDTEQTTDTVEFSTYSIQFDSTAAYSTGGLSSPGSEGFTASIGILADGDGVDADATIFELTSNNTDARVVFETDPSLPGVRWTLEDDSGNTVGNPPDYNAVINAPTRFTIVVDEANSEVRYYSDDSVGSIQSFSGSSFSLSNHQLGDQSASLEEMTLDEFRYYGEPLGEDEISEYGGYMNTFPAIYYAFDDADVNTIEDQGIAEIDSTVHGNPTWVAPIGWRVSGFVWGLSEWGYEPW